jgi:hypothetical protein
MCGRFILTSPGKDLAGHFGLLADPELSHRYNIAPTQMVAVVRFDQETTAKVKNPGASNDYPKSLNSNAKRALYYNLGQDEELALAVDMEIVGTKRDASRKKWKCVQADVPQSYKG